MGDTKPSVRFDQSAQQQALWNLTFPYWQSMYGQGKGMPSIWGVPQLPNAADYFSSTMPTGNWWGNLDPTIKEGIRQPYEEQANQLMETLGAKGMTGSQISPYSGSAATGLGQYWADVTPQMAQQGWNMMAPGLMAQAQAGWGGAMTGWQAELAQNQAQYQQSMYPYQMLPGISPMTMPYPIVSQGDQGLFGNLLGPGGMETAMTVLPWLAMAGSFFL